MHLIDTVLITLLNAAVCICLPRAIVFIGSIVKRRSLKLSSDRTASSTPDFSQTEAYSELTTAALK